MSPRAPRFSVVTPVYAPPLDALDEMIASVRDQTFDDWELVLVDDASPDEAVRETLRRHAAEDPRVRVVERETNGHIVRASNDGIAVAQGEFVVLVDHDDLLVRDALLRVSEVIDQHEDVDYVYSDEDKLAPDGSFYDAFRKPDWSPERLRGQMYTSHLSVLRTDVVRAVGGFHEGFDGSQDHDLVLRVTERARRVVHVPEVLYHWRVVPGSAAGEVDAKPYAWVAGRAAVQAHMDRLGLPCTVEFGRVTGTYRPVRELDPEILVSIVIPTRGGEGLVWGERRVFVVEAVRSMLERGGHQNVEIVVVHDDVTPAHVLDELRELAGGRLLLVPYAKPFNYSEKCNLGVVASHGSVVVLLNDDVEIASDDFLVQLVAPLAEPDVGMTGARLLFADSTIQHAGLCFYKEQYVHAFRQVDDADPGPFAALVVNREATGLTAASVALRREVFDEVGGLTEQLPGNFNDVDLSRKVAWSGRRLVWISEARAFHFESQSRVPVVQEWEHSFVRRRWSEAELDAYLPGLH